MIVTRKRRENQVPEEKPVPQCHFALTNPTWIGLRIEHAPPRRVAARAMAPPLRVAFNYKPVSFLEHWTFRHVQCK